jgi:hypothetical protein
MHTRIGGEQNKAVKREIEDLSSLFVDAGPQPCRGAVSSNCLHFAQGVSPHLKGDGSAAYRSTGRHTAELMGGRSGGAEAVPQGAAGVGVGDRDREQVAPSARASAFNAALNDGADRTDMQIRLLGESGEVMRSVYEALKKIEDVHCSDELMHFEFFGPFWELSEVRNETSLPGVLMNGGTDYCV